MHSPEVYRSRLIRQLRGACSGELAAGHAYRGHARSVDDPVQRARIHEIEAEEWHHRRLVIGLLGDLGAKPSLLREAVFWCIGHCIALFCRVGGWFLPMYGAGRLERSNIVEYEVAAEYALLAGHDEMVDCLLTMAEVEWEHERYFRALIDGHPFCRLFPLWDAAGSREDIRARYRALEVRPREVA